MSLNLLFNSNAADRNWCAKVLLVKAYTLTADFDKAEIKVCLDSFFSRVQLIVKHKITFKTLSSILFAITLASNVSAQTDSFSVDYRETPYAVEICHTSGSNIMPIIRSSSAPWSKGNTTLSNYFNEEAGFEVLQVDHIMMLRQVYELTTESNVAVVTDVGDSSSDFNSGMRGEIIQPYLNSTNPSINDTNRYNYLAKNTFRLREGDLPSERWLVLQGECPAGTRQTVEFRTPPITSVTINNISVDTGINDSDFITNVTNGLTISATLGGELAEGEKLEYSADSGSHWTDITASATGTSVNHFDSGLTSSATIQMRVVDSENNIGEVASQEIIIDTTAPAGHGVGFEQGVINGSNDNAVSFAFLGAETGAAYDYTISSSGGGNDVTGSGTVSSATDQIPGINVSGLADGTLTLSVVLTDIADNSATAVADTVLKDATAPTVSLTSNANDPHSGLFTVTATFLEEVTGFELGDITVVNGEAANLEGSGTTYTFDVTPTEDGAVTIDIAGNVAEDEASNGTVAAEQLTVMTDQTAPTISLTSNANDLHSGVFTVTATFSDEMTGFELGDITVVNGEAANLEGSGTTYTFDVTPTEDGAVTVKVDANVAEDAATNGNVASTQLSVSTDQTAPTVVISGPTDVVIEDFTVNFTFSEDVAGFTADDITVVNGTMGTFAGSSTTYTIVITPELGTVVSLSVAANVAADAAGNGNEASAVFEVQAGSPASEFAANLVEIRQVIVDEADRALRAALSVNQRMVRSARERFIAAQDEAVRCDQFEECNDGLVTDIDIPFDITGTADIANGVLSTRGSFFMQQSRMNGTKRRLSFGDFDIQHDGDTDSTTATITGRVAWENTVSEDTLLGYFVGGELGQSEIRSTNFAGDNHRYGLSVGGYVVHKLENNLYVDGFATLGVGRNNLEMSNDVLELESDYTTQTATIGGSMSGVIEHEQFQLRPELAFTYGKTWIGTVGFTGRAYGLVDDNLSLDANVVDVGQIMFQPEFLISLSDEEQTSDISTLSFAPRLICETSRGTASETDCGGGVELGLKSISADGTKSINSGASMERVGQSTRTNFRVNVEYRF